jgi:hypothetical protein
MESTPGEEAVNIVEMTTKDLEYYIKLVDKAAAGFERTESNSEDLLLAKYFQTAWHAIEKSFIKGKVNQFGKLQWSYFKKFQQPQQPSANTTLISQLPSTLRQDSYQQKD